LFSTIVLINHCRVTQRTAPAAGIETKSPELRGSTLARGLVVDSPAAAQKKLSVRKEVFDLSLDHTISF